MISALLGSFGVVIVVFYVGFRVGIWMNERWWLASIANKIVGHIDATNSDVLKRWSGNDLNIARTALQLLRTRLKGEWYGDDEI